MEKDRISWSLHSLSLIIIWESTFPLTRIAESQGINFTTLALSRFIIGGVFLFLISPRQKLKPLELIKFFLIGSLGIGFFVTLLFLSASISSTSLDATIIFSNPIILIPLSYFILGMKPNKREIMGSIIGIIGLILIMDPSISGENIGFLIAFLSTLSWALGSLLYKKHVSNYNTRISTSLQILLGGLPIAFLKDLL